MHLRASEIIHEARQWIGVPWRHQGRSRMGVDCVGLIVVVAAKFGLHPTGDVPNYGRRAFDQSLLESLAANGCERIAPRYFEPADVIAFHHGHLTCHLGLAAPDGRLIHSFARRRRVVEEPLGEWWLERMTSAWRLPES